MIDSKMLGRIRRSMFITNSGWLLLAAVVLFSVGALFALTSLPYFRAKFSPPTIVTLADLNRDSMTIPTYFASVTGDATYDSGYYYETTTQYIFKSQDYYGLLQLGDKFLLIYTDNEPDETRTEWTGTLKRTTPKVNLEVVSDIEQEVPQIAGSILPFTLDTVDASNWEWWAGLALLAAVGAFGVFALLRALRRFGDREQHPIWKRLMRYGTDVPRTVEIIERDIKGGSEKVGRMLLSESWIVAPGRDFRAMKIDDIVWMYQYTSKQYVNGIRVSVSHSATFHDKYGMHMAIPGKEKRVLEMLTLIYNRAPWAVTGHSDAIKAVWDKERQKLLDSVAAHKQAIRDTRDT